MAKPIHSYTPMEEGLKLGTGPQDDGERATCGVPHPARAWIRLTGALAVPMGIQAALLDAAREEMVKVYSDLADEAAAIHKIRTEPWCPDGALARLGKWESTKRKAIEAVCDRHGVPLAGLNFTVNGW